MKSAEAAELQVVVFGLNRGIYALPVTEVREVRRFEPLTPLPDSPAFIAGVLLLRGRILTVMDLGKRLGQEPTERNDKTRILIVRLSETWMGLLVDEVEGVVTLAKQALQTPPASAQTPNGHQFISTIFETAGRLVLLLDAPTLLSDEESKKLGSAPRRRKILLVDDSRTILTLFKGLFEQSGYDVLTATDGEDALQIALKQKPNLVILDGLLPRLDGFEVCRRLRSDAHMKSAKILMFTGGTEGEETEHARQVGADRFFSKDTKPGDILNAAHHLLNG